MDLDQKEKKNKQIGAAISVGLHVGILLLFFFLIAWRAPDPPLPEYGIELNFGLDDVGTGEVQPESNPAPTESEEEAAPDAPEEIQEEVEEVVEEEEIIEDPVEEMVDVTEEVIEPVENTTAIDKAVPQEVVTTQDSPDVVEQPKKQEVVKKVEQKPPSVLYPGKKDGAGGKAGDSKEAETANHGDNADEVGDKGVEEGTLDSRALYGKSGGGGGSSLDMAGWRWDFEPRPDDPSSESGKLVFEIKIDSNGEVTNVKTLERSVSSTIALLYQKEVEGLTFSKTSNSTSAPSSTTGKITFIIKAK
jgi:protein TonB